MTGILSASAAYAEDGQKRYTFTQNDMYPCIGFHPKVGTLKLPNCEAPARRSGFDYKLKTNSIGLRDKDYTPLKPPGMLRILMIGPSQLFAPGLEEPDTPPRMLEKILREKYQLSVEVINGSGEALQAVKSYILLKELLPLYKPDYVLHFSVGGDALGQDFKDHFAGTFEGDEIITSIDPCLVLQGYTGSPERAKQLNALNAGLRELYLGLRLRLSFSQEAKDALLIGPTVYYSLKIKKAAEAAGAKFIGIGKLSRGRKAVRLIPNMDANIYETMAKAVPEYTISADAQLTAYEKAGLQYIYLPPAFTSTENSSLFIPGDWHFSKLGSQRFAEYVADEIAAELGGKVAGK